MVTDGLPINFQIALIKDGITQIINGPKDGDRPKFANSQRAVR
jgi:hypothetical protein